MWQLLDEPHNHYLHNYKEVLVAKWPRKSSLTYLERFWSKVTDAYATYKGRNEESRHPSQHRSRVIC